MLLRYAPFIILCQSIIYLIINPSSVILFAIAATLFGFTEWLHRLSDINIQSITDSCHERVDRFVNDYHKHVAHQEKVIEDQAEIIERLRITTGFKDIH